MTAGGQQFCSQQTGRAIVHRPDRHQLRNQYVGLGTAVSQNIAQQQDAALNAEPASSSAADPTDVVVQFTAPRPLARLISQRLTILMQLDVIDRQRQVLARTPGLPHEANSELARQSRELKRIPTGEMAQATLDKLNRRLEGSDSDMEPDDETELQADEEVVDDSESLDADETVGDEAVEDEQDDQSDEMLGESVNEYELEFDDNEPDEQLEQDPVEDQVEAESPGRAPVTDPLHVEAIQLGSRQAEVFLQRESLTEPILAAAVKCCLDEELYRVLDTHGCDPAVLFGWTAYVSALHTMKNGAAEQAAGIDPRVARNQGRTKGDSLSPDQLRQRDEARLLASLQTAIIRELRVIEPVMVEEFWRVYEEAAVLIACGKAEPSEQLHLRAMLRYGVIGRAPWLLSPAIAEHIFAQCADVLTEWQNTGNATHLLYADEYLDMVANGHVTPSVDQDLELNARGSDRWKADRMWRRVVYGRTAETLLSELSDDMKARLSAISKANEKLESMESDLDSQAKDFRAKRAKLRDKLQHNKIEAARFQRGTELITDKYLAEQRADITEAQAKLGDDNEAVTPEALARREVAGIRQVCKLCAKLKEPFLPFVIRDKYRPRNGAANDRQTVLAEFAELERRDPTVFRQVLIHNKKAANRTYIRYSPYVILVPTLGVMGISWNPRSGSDVGRLVLPALCSRPGTLKRMLYEIVADFRFDTSKEEAGVDLMTSDTLVAAYATVRWDYRKRGKDVREKAAIYNEENDRKNWRRHYELHVSSAMDGGKKLFFRCPEAYEAVCKYMPLPEGIDKLE